MGDSASGDTYLTGFHICTVTFYLMLALVLLDERREEWVFTT